MVYIVFSTDGKGNFFANTLKGKKISLAFNYLHAYFNVICIIYSDNRFFESINSPSNFLEISEVFQVSEML